MKTVKKLAVPIFAAGLLVTLMSCHSTHSGAGGPDVGTATVPLAQAVPVPPSPSPVPETLPSDALQSDSVLPASTSTTYDLIGTGMRAGHVYATSWITNTAADRPLLVWVRTVSLNIDENVLLSLPDWRVLPQDNAWKSTNPPFIQGYHYLKTTSAFNGPHLDYEISPANGGAHRSASSDATLGEWVQARLEPGDQLSVEWRVLPSPTVADCPMPSEVDGLWECSPGEVLSGAQCCANGQCRAAHLVMVPAPGAIAAFSLAGTVRREIWLSEVDVSPEDKTSRAMPLVQDADPQSYSLRAGDLSPLPTAQPFSCQGLIGAN